MNRSLVRMTIVLAILLSLVSRDVSAETGRNRMTAFLLSCAVPGLGQWYAGSPGSARMFIASELMTLGGFVYTTRISDSYGNDYLRFASVHAGVNPGGYGPEYLAVLGAYDSSFDHARAQEQKSASPVTYEGPMAWNWDSYENRDRFKQIREFELNYENYAKYCVAGLILNHLLAGLHASQLVNRLSNDSGGVSIHPSAASLRAQYSWRF